MDRSTQTIISCISPNYRPNEDQSTNTPQDAIKYANLSLDQIDQPTKLKPTKIFINYIPCLILMGFAVYITYEGSRCVNNCGFNSNIPIWLFLFGVSKIAVIVLYGVAIVITRNDVSKMENYTIFIISIILFIIALFMAGNFLVYGEDDEIIKRLCLCYIKTYYIIIATWAYIVTGIVLFTVMYIYRRMTKSEPVRMTNYAAQTNMDHRKPSQISVNETCRL